VDTTQLGSHASGLTEVAVILACHPEWDCPPRWLKLPVILRDSGKITAKADHICRGPPLVVLYYVAVSPWEAPWYVTSVTPLPSLPTNWQYSEPHRTLSFLTWLCQSKPASWTEVRANRPLQTPLWVPIGTPMHRERKKCMM
jgi:hypothetical protein